MKHSEEINNGNKARTKRGANSRGYKDRYLQYDFDKFPLLKQTRSVLNFELALEFCEIDQMKKMSIFLLLLLLLFLSNTFHSADSEE